MIRDSRPKGSRDLDHVLHFAKRFENREKQIARAPLPWRAQEQRANGEGRARDDNEEQVSKVAN
jgi:hypothetical protein